jgi:hypothetical protein
MFPGWSRSLSSSCGEGLALRRSSGSGGGVGIGGAWPTHGGRSSADPRLARRAKESAGTSTSGEPQVRLGSSSWRAALAPCNALLFDAACLLPLAFSARMTVVDRADAMTTCCEASMGGLLRSPVAHCSPSCAFPSMTLISALVASPWSLAGSRR